MLARQLPGVVGAGLSSDRYLAGGLAEHQLGATVHVLDDGFQHLQLDRDIDLVIVAREDVERRADAAGRPAARAARYAASPPMPCSPPDEDVVVESAGPRPCRSSG